MTAWNPEMSYVRKFADFISEEMNKGKIKWVFNPFSHLQFLPELDQTHKTTQDRNDFADW